MKFRPRIIDIDAFVWTADIDQTEDPEWICRLIPEHVRFENSGTAKVAMLIDTPYGTMRAEVGDYIVRGTTGEIYPCKAKDFLNAYIAIPEPAPPAEP